MREPKPFFRKQTGTWYVQIGKKQHNLGPDEQVAKQKYHALMAGRQPVADDTTVYAVLFQFLGWNKGHRAGSTCGVLRSRVSDSHRARPPTVHGCARTPRGPMPASRRRRGPA